MSDLLPCPLCGKSARLVKKEGHGPAGGRFSRGYVACNRCGINTPTKSPWQKAVELWNRRAALANTSEQPEWQIIETAPKDGTVVLAWSDYWMGYEIVHWKPDENAWFAGDTRGFRIPPSHWMPLPIPPLHP